MALGYMKGVLRSKHRQILKDGSKTSFFPSIDANSLYIAKVHKVLNTFFKAIYLFIFLKMFLRL